ncbi:hypothetical protein Y032_0108g43 [Ancylostoma ceylanicum]|uniref:Uncharacterized protein n=1 Tax=Ancylostoma ceylanicum TaxID=53326 RepID=A0A016TEC5_9BILA|nr:hypothetical protein Y032_0108g43 [Ancylostoma ceylanicum]
MSVSTDIIPLSKNHRSNGLGCDQDVCRYATAPHTHASLAQVVLQVRRNEWHRRLPLYSLSTLIAFIKRVYLSLALKAAAATRTGIDQSQSSSEPLVTQASGLLLQTVQ